MKWLKLHNDILHDPKLKLIAPSDRWYFVAILCCKNEGYLEEEDSLRDEMLAVTLNLELSECLALRGRLEKRGLIDHNWEPIAWDKRQNSADPTGAERQRKFRENQQKAKAKAKDIVSNALRNGDVTLPEEEEEVEVEEEVNITSSSAKSDPVPFAKIVDLYHQKLPQLPAVQKMTSARQAAIRQRWKSGDLPALENWGNFFDYISQSEFLMGKAPSSNGRKPFVASLEWVCKESNYTKILEGNYHGV